MNKLNLLWLIFGSVIINTFRDLIYFYWMRKKKLIAAEHNHSSSEPHSNPTSSHRS